jgi:hypothetical protein
LPEAVGEDLDLGADGALVVGYAAEGDVERVVAIAAVVGEEVEAVGVGEEEVGGAGVVDVGGEERVGGVEMEVVEFEVG